MADKDAGGDKTEKPTPRKLRDARQKGDVAKSKDLTATAGLVAWLLLLILAGGLVGKHLVGLLEQALTAVASNNPELLVELGWASVRSFMILALVAMLPPVIIGLAVEFLQAGAVLTTEKMKPNMDHLNPVEGLKRMFSMDNLVDLLKTIAKAALLITITILVVRQALPDLLETVVALPAAPQFAAGSSLAAVFLDQHGRLAMQLIVWTLGAFLMVAAIDMAWQKHSYTKKLKMSMRDIRDEVKQDEGDPHVKGQRRQLHQEWAENNAVHASRTAHALVVNPTHIAVALDYHPEHCPIPLVAAIGEGPLAAAMRSAAEDEGVPILRYVQAARDLRSRAIIGDIIPADLFDVVAEVIAWANRARADAGKTSGPEQPA